MTDAPAARAPRVGEVVIDELLVDPAGNDLGHEWIEVANLTAEALDLSTLRVADEANEIAVDAGVLEAGGLLVLGQSTDRAHNGDAPVTVALRDEAVAQQRRRPDRDLRRSLRDRRGARRRCMDGAVG